MAIPLLPILTALPGVIDGVSSLFDGKRRNSQEKKASEGISNLTDVFKTSLEGNYLDTPEGARIMAEIVKNQQENTRDLNATAETTGMTDEAKIAYQGKNNEAGANAIGKVASGADIWRQRTQQQYGNSLGTLFEVGQTNRGNFNQSISNITQPLQGAIDTAANTGAFDGLEIFGKKKKKTATNRPTSVA